jgi:hypothetical protein
LGSSAVEVYNAKQISDTVLIELGEYVMKEQIRYKNSDETLTYAVSLHTTVVTTDLVAVVQLHK